MRWLAKNYGRLEARPACAFHLSLDHFVTSFHVRLQYRPIENWLRFVKWRTSAADPPHPPTGHGDLVLRFSRKTHWVIFKMADDVSSSIWRSIFKKYLRNSCYKIDRRCLHMWLMNHFICKSLKCKAINYWDTSFVYLMFFKQINFDVESEGSLASRICRFCQGKPSNSDRLEVLVGKNGDLLHSWNTSDVHSSLSDILHHQLLFMAFTTGRVIPKVL